MRYRLVATFSYVTPDGWEGSYQLPTIETIDNYVSAESAANVYREIVVCIMEGTCYSILGTHPETLPDTFTSIEVGVSAIPS